LPPALSLPPLASSPKSKDRTGIFGDLAEFRSNFANVVRYDWNVEAPPGEEITVDHYWNEYCRRDSRYYRTRRLAPIVVSYIALCVLIVSFDMPIPPVRGVASMVIDRVMPQLSVISFILLVFNTFDVIRTCRRLIQLLVDRMPQ
jgi:hypothetical protein